MRLQYEVEGECTDKVINQMHAELASEKAKKGEETKPSSVPQDWQTHRRNETRRVAGNPSTNEG